jgi:hypothetical protein
VAEAEEGPEENLRIKSADERILQKLIAGIVEAIVKGIQWWPKK